MPTTRLASQDLVGTSPPSLFVGRHGYPKVLVGPMLPPDHRDADAARGLDDPRTWITRNIPEIVGQRSSLVRTTHAVRVDAAHGGRDVFSSDRIVRVSQELAIAARPVDAEVRLDRPVQFGDVTVGEFTPPHGPTAQVERAALTENVRVEAKVERKVSDTDARAADAAAELYQSGTDSYQIERILSAGLLGQASRRRLVPTRWAITATDDQLGHHLIDKVVDFQVKGDIRVHFAERLGNRFFVLFWPRSWAFESIEAWMKGNFWTQGREAATVPESVVETDWEDHRGRKTYAASAGGYYATRLAVLEHLVERREQATAVVLREITDAYTTPLGVWVVREACKAALAAKPLLFEDLDAATRHVGRHALHKRWTRDAPMLDRLRREPSLDSFT
jgi:hypothetical protein